jgi:hypothetical protein
MSLSFEDQLLLQCARANMSDVAVNKAADLLQENLDWDYILEASTLHGVAPLLHRSLTQLARVLDIVDADVRVVDADVRVVDTDVRTAIVPLAIREELERLYLNSRARNQRLYRVIGEVCRALEQAGVQAMGLKDAQLAWEVYPDIGLRPMGDIDILIHPEDYDKTATCMAGLGFTRLPNPDIPFTLKYAWAHHFRRPSDDVWVDMQWNVLQKEWDIYHEGNFDFEIDRMWRGAILMRVGEYQILVPKPEDMLFHLCMHLEGHTYSELILFCDIAELLKHYDNQLDWKYLVDITKKYKAESSVYYVLLMVQHLFDVCLPPFLLRELEPAYFKASIFKPLFGNLTTLHLSLDQIQLAASPPDDLMRKFETAVRCQAVGAMRLYKEIDHVASAFMDSGGDLIILGGTASEKAFPDSSLTPFGEIRLMILDHDLPRMRQTLLNCGFEPRDVADADIRNLETYTKQWQVTSIDPLLADRPPRMALQGDIEMGLDYLFQPKDSHDTSKGAVALKLLKAKLGHENGSADIPVRIKIIALSPEDMALAQSARLGRLKKNRLFGLCSMHEFFRGYSGPLDWQRVTSTAQRYGVSGLVCEGLQLASELFDDGRIPASALALDTCSDTRPRVLKWARYGPAALDRRTSLRGAFFFLFSFLSIDGAKLKSRYLLRSLFGHRSKEPVLPGLMLEFVTSTLSSLRRKQSTARDFAYWTKPEPSPETDPANRLKA